MKRLMAMVLVVTLLAGCAGGGEPELRELPAARQTVEQQLTDLELDCTVRPGEAVAEGHTLYELAAPEGGSVATLDSYADAERRFVRVTMYAPRGQITGVPAGDEESYCRLACDLYSDGLDAGALWQGFEQQLEQEPYRDRSPELTDLVLLEQQGELYALLRLTYDEEGLRWRTLWLGNRAVYDDGMKEQFEVWADRAAGLDR